MMNEYLNIVLESAEADNRVMAKYVGTSEGVTDFVKDKASVAYEGIKKLYEKVMATIDEIILKVLNFKDKGMTKLIRDKFEKVVFVEGKKYNGKQVGFDNLNAYIAKLPAMVESMSDSKIKPKENTQDAIDGVWGHATNLLGLDRMINQSEVESYVGKNIVSAQPVKAIVIDKAKFESAKKFMVAPEGAVKMLDDLRRLKLSTKKAYKEILSELKKGLKEEKEKAADSDAKRKVATQAATDKTVARKVFEIVSYFIIKGMAMIKDAITVSGKIAAAYKDKDKKEEQKKDAQNFNGDSRELTVSAGESALLDDIDLAILEADLSF